MKKSALIRLVNIGDRPIRTTDDGPGPKIAIRMTTRGLVALAYRRSEPDDKGRRLIEPVGHAKVDMVSGGQMAENFEWDPEAAFNSLVNRYNFQPCYSEESAPVLA